MIFRIFDVFFTTANDLESYYNEYFSLVNLL